MNQRDLISLWALMNILVEVSKGMASDAKVAKGQSRAGSTSGGQARVGCSSRRGSARVVGLFLDSILLSAPVGGSLISVTPPAVSCTKVAMMIAREVLEVVTHGLAAVRAGNLLVDLAVLVVLVV